jgi:hypothetical protein
MIRVILPPHLRALAGVRGEVELDVEGPATQREGGGLVRRHQGEFWKRP